MLDVEDVIAQLLVTEGYISIEGIANESIETLEKIEGFDNELAKELLERSNNYIITTFVKRILTVSHHNMN